MKKLLSCLFAVAVGALMLSQAQAGYDLTTLVSAAENQTIAYGTTTNFTDTVSIKDADSAVVYVEFKLTGTGTGNIIFNLKESVDGVNYPTAVTHSLTNAATSGTLVQGIHALTLKKGITLRLTSIKNDDDAETLTNLVVKVGVGTR